MERLENIKGLKPCPFCGNTKPYVIKWIEKVYSVCCGNERYCSCEMGNSISIEGAKRIWNRRRYKNTLQG